MVREWVIPAWVDAVSAGPHFAAVPPVGMFRPLVFQLIAEVAVNC
jgi:hypothetical protein